MSQSNPKKREHKLIRGIVRHGDKRGRALGYPTANIRLHRAVRDGVYIAITRVAGKEYPSLAFVGAAKTFNQQDRKLEVYLLDATLNLYGKWLSVQLLSYVRGNIRFDSIEGLQKAMKNDEIQARQFFSL